MMTSTMPKADIESSIFIERIPEDIWNYFSDVSNDMHWRNEVIDAKWVSDPPYDVGSTGLHIVEGIGDWPWEVFAWEPPRIMAWRVTGGRFEGGQGAYRVEPEGTGSRITIETTMPKGIIMKLFAFFLKGRIKNGNAADLVKIKAIMEE